MASRTLPFCRVKTKELLDSESGQNGNLSGTAGNFILVSKRINFGTGIFFVPGGDAWHRLQDLITKSGKWQ